MGDLLGWVNRERTLCACFIADRIDHGAQTNMAWISFSDLLVEDLEMCVEREHPTQAWVPLRLLHLPDGLPKPAVIFLHVTGVGVTKCGVPSVGHSLLPSVILSTLHVHMLAPLLHSNVKQALTRTL